MTQVSPSASINHSISPIYSSKAEKPVVAERVVIDDQTEEDFWNYGGVPTGGGYLPESDVGTGVERKEDDKKPEVDCIPVPVLGEDFEHRKPRISRRPLAPTKAGIGEHFPLITELGALIVSPGRRDLLNMRQVILTENDLALHGVQTTHSWWAKKKKKACGLHW